MEKKLLLSLLCIVQIELIQPAVALSTDASLSQSDFIEKTKLLEEKKAALVSRIQEIDARIEAIRDVERSATGPSNPAALFLIPALIAGGHEQEALEKKQVKNKLDLADLDTSLETAYFEQLDPFWKKKLLLSKIKANKSESEELSRKMPALLKTSQARPFYGKLSLLNAAALMGTLTFAGATKSNPNLKHLHNLSQGMFAAFLFSIIFPLAKYCIASDAHRELETIKKKLLELEMKKPGLVHEVSGINSSLADKKPTLETLAVVPSNELFQAVYDAAHFEQLDTEGKKKKLLSKIEVTTIESNTLTNEASSLEKTAAKKPLYWKYLGASCAYFMSAAYLTNKVKVKPYSFSDYALGAYILCSMIPAFVSFIKIEEADEAQKKLEEVKKKIIELKEQTAKHSADLATL